MSKQPRSRSRRAEAGQSLAEFALIFPILMILLVAIFDLGRLVFAYNDITNAAREGARVAIVDQTTTTIQNEVINQATSLGLTAAAIDVDYVTTDDPDVACADIPPTKLGCVVVVTVNYDWQAITPIIGNIIGPVTVTSVSKMPVERIFP